MEPQVYEIIITYTLIRNGKNIVHHIDPVYRYIDEPSLQVIADGINKEYSTFDEAQKAIDAGVFSYPFFNSESLFGKKRITHESVFREPLHTTEKQFGGMTKTMKYYLYDSTIKDYAEKLSADDFIEYCMSKGLDERWLSR